MNRNPYGGRVLYCRQLSGGAVPRARAVGKIPDILNASSYLEYYIVM